MLYLDVTSELSETSDEAVSLVLPCGSFREAYALRSSLVAGSVHRFMTPCCDGSQAVNASGGMPNWSSRPRTRSASRQCCSRDKRTDMRPSNTAHDHEIRLPLAEAGEAHLGVRARHHATGLALGLGVLWSLGCGAQTKVYCWSLAISATIAAGPAT